jgi:hypothetical protein
MGINDEMARQRNSEIANDNYYRLKWLLEAAREFVSKLDKDLAEAKAESGACGSAKVEILESVIRDTNDLRHELER